MGARPLPSRPRGPGAGLTILDDVSRPPAARKSEDSRGQLRTASWARRCPTPTRKEAAAVVKVRSGRLYEAICMGRTWPVPLRRVLFASHRWPGFRWLAWP